MRDSLSQEAIPITLSLMIQRFVYSNSAITHPGPPLSTSTRGILLFRTNWVSVRQGGMANPCGVGDKI